jgi:hypothetical protein
MTGLMVYPYDAIYLIFFPDDLPKFDAGKKEIM